MAQEQNNPDIGERLAAIETKVDYLVERATEDRTDFQGRIRGLEIWRYGTGAAIIASAINLFGGNVPKP
ncbi:hypothetical protein SEA_YARA_24 [Streptomyces phage Yara]|nr:hypothetical protein SEA_YARA_24 [Streptomyces phage Yara]